jgi:FixJ family two-component response regulator
MAGEEAVVYVVDDDSAARAAIQNLLQSVGLRAQTFGSAQEFLASPRPDVPPAWCWMCDCRESVVSTFNAT